jgi:hypothetical protein
MGPAHHVTSDPLPSILPADGQTQGTGRTAIWLYTPPQTYGLSSFTSAPSPAAPAAGTPTSAPTLGRNVDLGGNALHEVP